VPPLPSGLSFEDGNDKDPIRVLRKFEQKQTKEFVEKNERLVPPLPSGLSFENSNDAEKFKEFVRLEARKFTEPVKLIWQGYTHRKDPELYVAEIHPPKWHGKQKIGLGSYRTQIAAAMAFDVGIHYTNKNTYFNILSHAPRVLPLPSGLSFEDGNDIEAIRKFVQKQTKEFVEKNKRLVPPLPSGLSFENSNDAEKIKEFVRLEARKFVDVDEHHVETAPPPTSGPVEAADLGFQGTEAFRAAGPSSSSLSEDLALSPNMARVAKDELLDNQADRFFWELLLMPAPLNPVDVKNQGSQDVKLALPAALLPENCHHLPMISW
jgi:hypothetical protein